MPPDVFLFDDLHPEDAAMLQALYSRSPASVLTHLEKLRQVGSGTFMEQYYVGYGHASIGDCGATTLFLEGVSMLAAKAVQDSPLYNGQEASTRYLDFARQSVLDPYAHPASAAIQDGLKALYSNIRPRLEAALEARHPFDPTAHKSERIWRNALAARSFDIARSLLPMGTTTLLSWTTSLRHARDSVRRLATHPLPEVRDLAKAILIKLRERYPHSFKPDDATPSPDDARCTYARDVLQPHHVPSAEDLAARWEVTEDENQRLRTGEVLVRRAALDLPGLRRHEVPALTKRPRGAALPWALGAYGCYSFLFLLDFGSFRDLQRHRNGVCPQPIFDTSFGFHPWYLAQIEDLLGPEAATSVRRALDRLFANLEALPRQGGELSPALTQYLLPMGMRGLVHVAYTVPQTVYVGELRSGATVHPTLRPVAQRMLSVLAEDVPGIALYGDFSPDAWSPRRGEQTITAQSDRPSGGA